LTITVAAVAGTCVLTVYGVLNNTTYFRLRDAVIKAALDAPRAVIIDVTCLVVSAPSAWVVFTSARWQIDQWPDIPIALVCDNIEDQKLLRHNGISRYIPVYWTVDAAIAALSHDDQHSSRRRARAELPAGNSGISRCRELAEQWLTAWNKKDYIAVASAVATVLVENALTQTGGALSLRLESKGSTVAVAVQYPSTAAVKHRETADCGIRGLERVAATCRAWGSIPTSSGTALWVVIGPESCF
jgi:hypothetical protein